MTFPDETHQEIVKRLTDLFMDQANEHICEFETGQGLDPDEYMEKANEVFQALANVQGNILAQCLVAEDLDNLGQVRDQLLKATTASAKVVVDVAVHALEMLVKAQEEKDGRAK